VPGGLVLSLLSGSSPPGASLVLARALDVAGVATGLVLATYTGVLLGATSVPVWARHARLLPAHFGASSLGAAASILELAGHLTPALNAIALAAAAAETAIGIRLEHRRELTATALGAGNASVLTRIGDVGSGPLPLVLRLLAAIWPGARLLAAISAIVGSISTRFGWLAAGRGSVKTREVRR
jgi:formate-dependent nitrite reductase membrane component NrfD